jgi:tetratricopeptide (TPR) repeat protein
VARRGLKSWALPALCAGAVLCLASCDLLTSPEKRLERAEQLLEQGSYGAAVVEIRNVLAKTPENARAQLALARASLQLGDSAAAGKALQAAATGGANAGAIAEVQANIDLRRGSYAELLKGLDAGTLPVSEPQKSVLRTQALAGLVRCDDARELALALKKQYPKLVPNRVVLAECYGRHGVLSSALNELDEAVAVAPESAEAWLARGRFQRLMGKSKDAEASWEKALKYAPGHLSVLQQLTMLSQLADFQIAREDLTAASEAHQQMVQLAPDGAITQLFGARLTLLSGDYASATAELRKLTGRVPDLTPAKFLLVSALLADGNVEQALQQIGLIRHEASDNNSLAEIEKGVATVGKQSRNSETYWLGLGGMQVVLGQLPLARVAIAKAGQVAPQSPQARAALAQLELLTGHSDKALAIARDLAAGHADDVRFALLLANVHSELGQYADAATTLEKVWQAQPSAASALAVYRVRERGRLGNETVPLKQWLTRNPGDLQVRAAYAEALRVAGDRTQAIAEYEKVLAAAPQNPIVLNNLAWLYHLQGDARALPTAQKAVQIAPNVLGIRDTYGWLLVASGAAGEGVRVLKSAYEEGGAWLPDVTFHYAAALVRTDDAPRARELLARLLDESPQFDTRADAQQLLSSLE